MGGTQIARKSSIGIEVDSRTVRGQIADSAKESIIPPVTAEENLRQLGLELPDPPAPVGAYVTWVRTGNLLVTSGQLPWSHKTMLWPGRLGEQVSVEDGYKAPRQAG